MANCLYLEWFSGYNGRVVIESTEYQITISPPEWTLTPEENEQRAKEAAAGLTGFMQRLGEAFDAEEQQETDSEKDSDEQQ